MTVAAALYIDARGPYPKLLGPEMCWDAERDARTYAGPWPVVAHPPCGPWGKLSFVSHENAEVKALAPRAVEQVRAFGGVLEHPVGSRLLDFCGLPHPGELPDSFGGVTIEVAQVHWGHPARKRTWLYLVGIPSSAIEVAPFPTREPTHWVSGSRSPRPSGTARDEGLLRATASTVPPPVRRVPSSPRALCREGACRVTNRTFYLPEKTPVHLASARAPQRGTKYPVREVRP